MELVNTSGRRKTSVARVYIKPTKGEPKFTVNKREFKEYFSTEVLQLIVNQPFAITEDDTAYDINVNVTGGGVKGQAEATRLAISKALLEFDAENRGSLKKEGLLTRDPRMVERKKPGRRKARRAFQFSKR